jgi:NAD(P)-dependent dehydrogenase (short-subunit alcohol dehydrogenase family)
MSIVTDSYRSDLFAEQQVLVIGGSRGIGLGIAEAFARLGARVLATGRSVGSSQTAARIEFVKLDVRDRNTTTSFISAQSSLKVLVNCAGIARPHEEFQEDVFNEVMDINLNSFMWTSMAARNHLAASAGSIINIASMLSFLADPDVPAYCASKTGVLGLTRSLAFAFGGDKIRVNAIAPGYHKTNMTQAHWENPEIEQRIANRSALKRWGSVEDLVGAAIFLASPAAQFITGTTLAVDGGYSLG